jgi:hypothetical protein
MLQAIVSRSFRRTEGRIALTTPISTSPSRASFVKSVGSNCPLLCRLATWTFGVGTTWILHGCLETRPIPSENQPKLLGTNDFQEELSQLITEAPEKPQTLISRPDSIKNSTILFRLIGYRYGKHH